MIKHGGAGAIAKEVCYIIRMKAFSIIVLAGQRSLLLSRQCLRIQLHRSEWHLLSIEFPASKEQIRCHIRPALNVTCQLLPQGLAILFPFLSLLTPPFLHRPFGSRGDVLSVPLLHDFVVATKLVDGHAKGGRTFEDSRATLGFFRDRELRF